MVIIELTLDCADADALAEFWKAAVGYEDEPPPAPYATRRDWLRAHGEPIGPDEPLGGAWLVDPDGRAARLSLLNVPEPKTVKNRLHLDLRVSDGHRPEERWAIVCAARDRLLELGATTRAEFEGHHVVLADPEGNEFCVA